MLQAAPCLGPPRPIQLSAALLLPGHFGLVSFSHRQVLPYGDPRARWVARRSGLAESLLGPRAHPAALPSVQGTRALSTVNTNAPTNYFNVRADYFKASGLASTSLRESARLGARRCPMGMGARRTVWPHRVFALPYRGPRVGRIVQQLGTELADLVPEILRTAQARARATVHGWSRFLYKYILYTIEHTLRTPVTTSVTSVERQWTLRFSAGPGIRLLSRRGSKI